MQRFLALQVRQKLINKQQSEEQAELKRGSTRYCCRNRLNFCTICLPNISYPYDYETT